MSDTGFIYHLPNLTSSFKNRNHHHHHEDSRTSHDYQHHQQQNNNKEKVSKRDSSNRKESILPSSSSPPCMKHNQSRGAGGAGGADGGAVVTSTNNDGSSSGSSSSSSSMMNCRIFLLVMLMTYYFFRMGYMNMSAIVLETTIRNKKSTITISSIQRQQQQQQQKDKEKQEGLFYNSDFNDDTKKNSASERGILSTVRSGIASIWSRTGISSSSSSSPSSSFWDNSNNNFVDPYAHVKHDDINALERRKKKRAEHKRMRMKQKEEEAAEKKLRNNKKKATGNDDEIQEDDEQKLVVVDDEGEEQNEYDHDDDDDDENDDDEFEAEDGPEGEGREASEASATEGNGNDGDDEEAPQAAGEGVSAEADGQEEGENTGDVADDPDKPNEEEEQQQESSPTIKINYPVLVASLYKSGTVSIHEYFKCGNQRSVHHQFKKNNRGARLSTGSCIKKNIDNKIPPFQNCGTDGTTKMPFDIYSHNNIFDSAGTCYDPSVYSLDAIYDAYPNGTILVMVRDSHHWINSVENASSKKLLSTLLSCRNLWPTQEEDLMASMIGDDTNTTKTATTPSLTKDDVRKFYLWHIHHLRTFAIEHPSMTYIEVPLESNETTAEILEEKIGIPSSCWSWKNYNPNYVRNNNDDDVHEPDYVNIVGNPFLTTKITTTAR